MNSDSSTSIKIDRFNSIELHVFPFYPNPPPLHDWQVPIALVDLSLYIEANWDLALSKICPYVDGINHVSRIAALADCDIDFARKAILHLLYIPSLLFDTVGTQLIPKLVGLKVLQGRRDDRYLSV